MEAGAQDELFRELKPPWLHGMFLAEVVVLYMGVVVIRYGVSLGLLDSVRFGFFHEHFLYLSRGLPMEILDAVALESAIGPPFFDHGIGGCC